MCLGEFPLHQLFVLLQLNPLVFQLDTHADLTALLVLVAGRTVLPQLALQLHQEVIEVAHLPDYLLAFLLIVFFYASILLFLLPNCPLAG
jgi:hypothetical protein